MPTFKSQRVIFEDDTTLIDASVALNDFRTGTLAFDYTVTDDFLYFGMALPFNHLWIEVGTVNSNAAVATWQIWFGNDWISAVDVIDQTAVAGAPLAKSEILQFNTDRLKGWDVEQDSADVDGLETTAIYNLYWARLSYSASLSVGTVLAFVGLKFSDDAELFLHYPDLNSTALQAAFASGKTDWNDQAFMAADDIVLDLKRRGLVLDKGQIIDHELFKDASLHKVAELIYFGLGTSREEDRKAARTAYDHALNMGKLNLDQNRDGRLDRHERRITTGLMHR